MKQLTFFGFCWIRWFGSWDFDFQILNLGNETADLILTRGGLGLGVVALWGAHARQMSETAMSIPLFLFVFLASYPGFLSNQGPHQNADWRSWKLPCTQGQKCFRRSNEAPRSVGRQIDF